MDGWIHPLKVAIGNAPWHWNLTWIEEQEAFAASFDRNEPITETFGWHSLFPPLPLQYIIYILYIYIYIYCMPQVYNEQIRDLLQPNVRVLRKCSLSNKTPSDFDWFWCFPVGSPKAQVQKPKRVHCRKPSQLIPISSAVALELPEATQSMVLALKVWPCWEPSHRSYGFWMFLDVFVHQISQNQIGWIVIDWSEWQHSEAHPKLQSVLLFEWLLPGGCEWGPW